MSTDILYGVILLKNVLIRDYSQEPARDPSGTDRWYDDFTIRLQTTVSPGAFNAGLKGISHGATSFATGYQPGVGNVPNAPNTANAAQVLAYLQQYLMRDRQRFQLVSSGVIMLDVGTGNLPTIPGAPNSGGANGQPDCNNGPKVVRCECSAMPNGSIAVDFSIRVALSGCAKNPAVLGNRWAQTDDYDEDFACKRTWTGTLRFATNNVKQADFRNNLLPPLQKGFKRHAARFAMQADGLVMNYQVDDHEMIGEAPPSPATRMRGTHREAFGPDGVKALGSISLRLDGPRSASKSDMIKRANDIIFRKVGLSGFINGTGNGTVTAGAILAATFATYFGDSVNAVECQCEYMRTLPKGITDVRAGAATAGATSLDLLSKSVGDLGLPGYSADTAVIMDAFGTAGTANIVACLLQTTCGDHTYPGTTTQASSAKATGGQSGGGTSGTEAKMQSSVSTTNTLPPVNYSDASNPYKNQPYSFYHVDLVYEKTYNRVQLPIAAASSSAEAAPPDSSVVVTLGPPTCRLRASIKAERLNTAPSLVADMDFTGSDKIRYSILDYQPSVRPPLPMGDGKNTLYSMDADYLWAMSRAPAPGASLSVATLPWNTNTVTEDSGGQTYVAPTNQDQGLIA